MTADNDKENKKRRHHEYKIGDLVLIIQAIDEYDFMPLDLNFGSQEIYNKYFDQTDDRPFQGYAFEFSLNVTSTLKELIQ